MSPPLSQFAVEPQVSPLDPFFQRCARAVILELVFVLVNKVVVGWQGVHRVPNEVKGTVDLVAPVQFSALDVRPVCLYSHHVAGAAIGAPCDGWKDGLVHQWTKKSMTECILKLHCNGQIKCNNLPIVASHETSQGFNQIPGHAGAGAGIGGLEGQALTRDKMIIETREKVRVRTCRNSPNLQGDHSSCCFLQ